MSESDPSDAPQSERKVTLVNRSVMIFAITWALAPWFFALVYAFHPFQHADPFWLPAFPLMMASFIPMLIADSSARGFPLQWVVVCSIFNLVAGSLLACIVAALRADRRSR